MYDNPQLPIAVFQAWMMFLLRSACAQNSLMLLKSRVKKSFYFYFFYLFFYNNLLWQGQRSQKVVIISVTLERALYGRDRQRFEKTGRVWGQRHRCTRYDIISSPPPLCLSVAASHLTLNCHFAHLNAECSSLLRREMIIFPTADNPVSFQWTWSFQVVDSWVIQCLPSHWRNQLRPRRQSWPDFSPL